MMKEVVESAILSKDRKTANHILQECYEKFCKMPPEIIATRKKVNNLLKWQEKVDDDGKLGKGTPQHTGGTIYFNSLLKELKITDKYQAVESGSKIKYVYCKKNKYNYKVLAFGDEYPKEILEVVKPDYKMMFEKNVLPVVGRIFHIIGWPIPSIGCEEHTDLIQLFS
jgi:DNA polymerase elongation subunit (family B)